MKHLYSSYRHEGKALLERMTNEELADFRALATGIRSSNTSSRFSKQMNVRIEMLASGQIDPIETWKNAQNKLTSMNKMGASTQSRASDFTQATQDPSFTSNSNAIFHPRTAKNGQKFGIGARTRKST